MKSCTDISQNMVIQALTCCLWQICLRAKYALWLNILASRGNNRQASDSRPLGRADGEAEMGLTYEDLDKYLATGVATEEVKAKIDAAITRSEHKRIFSPMAVLPKEL